MALKAIGLGTDGPRRMDIDQPLWTELFIVDWLGPPVVPFCPY